MLCRHAHISIKFEGRKNSSAAQKNRLNVKLKNVRNLPLLVVTQRTFFFVGQSWRRHFWSLWATFQRFSSYASTYITLLFFSIYTEFLFSGYLYIKICLLPIILSLFIYRNNAKNDAKIYIITLMHSQDSVVLFLMCK